MTDAPDSSAPVAGDPTPTFSPQVDISKAQCLYINFCRVTSTPEELVFDFAYQMTPTSDADPPLVTPQRITLGQLTAKRLLAVLQMTIQRHETAFGTVKTTIEDRLFVLPG